MWKLRLCPGLANQRGCGRDLGAKKEQVFFQGGGGEERRDDNIRYQGQGLKEVLMGCGLQHSAWMQTTKLYRQTKCCTKDKGIRGPC